MKKFLLVLLTLLLAALIALEFYWDPAMAYLGIDQSGWAAWKENHYYLDENGDPLTGLQEIDGYTYCFDTETGIMQTGWQNIGDNRYCFDTDGRMLTDCWLQDDNGTCYLRLDGTMATGWVDDGTVRYYFLETGYPASGWVEVDGVRSCFGDNGAALSGWQEIDGQRYYLTENGTIQTGWQEIGGAWYYLNEDGTMATGWVETEEGKFYLNADGTAASGWAEIDGIRCYIGENGLYGEGWNEIDGKRYYFNSDGSCHTGWLELDGVHYYLTENGAATGKLLLEDRTYYFTSTGAKIILVNPWNYIPEDYQVELVTLDDGHKVAAEMKDALAKMMADCEAAGHKPFLKSAYRTHADQQANFNRILAKYGNDRVKAAQVVAVPGTSEHQLGLAVDITDYNYRDLDYDQEKTETQKWLMEHCWEYGFILRYPSEKSAITGIIYEPWHYRYVGTELSMEMKDSGLCLEEYLEKLTPSAE